MRRILMVLAVAAFMVAMMGTAVPAFAAAPDAGCPTGFTEGPNTLGSDAKGTQSAFVNDSPEICTKQAATPQNPAWCPPDGSVDPCPYIQVFRDDTTGGPK